MMDLIIRQAKQLDGSLIDVVAQQGVIYRIGPDAAKGLQAKREIDVAGRWFISAGWIDAHTHCCCDSPLYHDEPDRVGVACGVTTVVDAGSCGADNIAPFERSRREASTHVYALINIARTGINTQHELSDLTQIDQQALQQAVEQHPDFIVGLKARMSKSVVGDNGLEPLRLAKAMQKHNGLPLMVHVGNTPPSLDEIADLLDKGDIITHCFNGKPNRILNQEGQLRPAVQRAIARGVVLDVGHGGESFSFAVAEQAMKIGTAPDLISSDIYERNRIQGPVYSLANVMNKFLCMGYSPQQIIDCVTCRPAQLLHLRGKGVLHQGADADFTLFDLRDGPIEMSDAHGEVRTGQQQFIPVAAIISGNEIVRQTEEI
ncbi:MAG: amidohydrolase/deacetylase family metallohydrolase [Enterobacteriaceae bacterium]